MADVKRVAINGLGRIGRATLKVIHEAHPDLEVVAVNDIAAADDLAYLLHYDSVYGRFGGDVRADGDAIVVDGRRYLHRSERDPEQLPWEELEIDLVFECTGRFTATPDLEKHLRAGADRVILSAPSKDPQVPMVVLGANAPPDDARMVSCASCTTNCITPVIEVLERRVGVRKAIMTTVHAFTSSQALVDMPMKKRRRGRSGAVNLVPTTTGAAIATTRVLPELEGRFDGVAIRAPVPIGSVSDIVVVVDQPSSTEEIVEIFREEARSERYRDILGVSEDEIVSTDIIRDPRASIVDLALIQVIDGDLVKVMSWYDNEWGYSNQMVRTAEVMVGNVPPPRIDVETAQRS